MAKEVSRSTFVWAHVATILAHILLGVLVLVAAGQSKNTLTSGNYHLLMACGLILIVLSVLSLYPVVNRYTGGIRIGV